jgi:hypothetical protein
MKWCNIIIIALFSILNSAAHAENHFCADDKRVVAECYDVHGRLALHANMRLYLWPTGTKRLLAISYKPNAPQTDPLAPPELIKVLSPTTDILGDFHICPFTPEKPGRQQIVCIDVAKHWMAVKKSSRASKN